MAVIKCRLPGLMLLVFLSYGCRSGTQSEQRTAPAVEKPKYEVYTVNIKDMKFVPDTLTVKKGDKIYFVNRDLVNHCVTEHSKAWTSGPIQPNGEYLLAADKSSEYYCAIHTIMKGKIIVQDK